MAAKTGGAAQKAAGRKPAKKRVAPAPAKPAARRRKPRRSVIAVVGGDEAARRAAAAGVARESGATLYRVDLGRLINKYIGETEKAIAAVLSRVEDENVVLFFDEADALLGKGTDVRDAHDRYAGQAVSYLFGFRRATPQVDVFADVVIRARPRRKKDD